MQPVGVGALSLSPLTEKDLSRIGKTVKVGSVAEAEAKRHYFFVCWSGSADRKKCVKKSSQLGSLRAWWLPDCDDFSILACGSGRHWNVMG